MAKGELCMWKYWRDKYGTATALEEYFADELAHDPALQMALGQIKINTAYIDEVMKAKADQRETTAKDALYV